jgi:hypothetical protein
MLEDGDSLYVVHAFPLDDQKTKWRGYVLSIPANQEGLVMGDERWSGPVTPASSAQDALDAAAAERDKIIRQDRARMKK